MSKRNPIPVTIVSGFLGAGKTTLLNRILTSDHGLRMAVMVNDFGAINIDSQLIVSQTQTMVSLANGCICCTVESDLIEQLGRLLDDRANRPEYIVIEASGVSNPSKIANTLRYPQFREALAIDSILTVVDAEQFGQLDGAMAQLAMEQLDVADIIVVNKVDRVGREQIDALKARWFYPNARVLESQYGEVPLELVLGVGRFKAGWSFRPAAVASAPVVAAVKEEDHSVIFETWSFASERPMSLKALRQALSALPADIYRAKGVCQIAEAPGKRCILHLVGSRSEILPESGWEGREPYTQLVFIGKRGSIDTASMQAAFGKCVA
ncbi:GTP-binding protein [Pseudomonas sp. JS3066]|jgi:G3E family GTPase|uniref:CobW family GTP-binding protein n=1 Tax=unclassified Pseudomonas TaxID=196821 RepID=UPI000EAACDC9|nr:MULTISPECIES: GTP-binding protein [unclassified Pseudomonas]AYF86574.1 GTP-binding protein [Pseudomonas sp. DY-1]MDH4654689.1 GTP-binding protein [Pseudomonas sp. BN606]MRK23926.1 GTP-binding protein [Pseudomonas sp. JG-B]WVK95957.1 GTP-binding protein [Pseudomonas sp. JS3066]